MLNMVLWIKRGYGSIIILFRDNIKVYRSESVSDTIYFLERMIEKLKNDKINTLNIINKNNTNNLKEEDEKKVKLILI